MGKGKDTRLQYLFAGSKAADAAAEGK